MLNTLKITKYYLTYTFKWYFLGVAALLLIHLVASLLVDHLVAPEREAGLVAPLIILGSFALGGLFFSSSFTYLMQQGISRLRFFISTGLNLAMVALIFSVFLMIYYAVMTGTVYSIGSITIFEAIYHDQNLFSLLVWESAVLFLMAVGGWLVSVVSYRSGLKTRIVLYFGAVILTILSAFLINLSGGEAWRVIGEFLQTALGLDSVQPNPYMAAFSFFTFSLILLVPVYLLLRRASIKN